VISARICRPYADIQIREPRGLEPATRLRGHRRLASLYLGR
jgi:hypothetical protein